MIDSAHPHLSVTRQCALVGLSRAAYYYVPQPLSPEDRQLMRLLDEEYTRHPFKGSRRLADWFHSQGYPVGRHRVRRLMREMGLAAIAPTPRPSVPAPGHQVYPYLLRTVTITHPNQVWCSDITYIRLHQAFVYLTAIMDWFSRYVLAYVLSRSLTSDFCIQALHHALTQATPEIFNSDQGSQYTCEDFTAILKQAHVQISMAGAGRCFDNIMVERLWRTVKYEAVYLHEYTDYWDAQRQLGEYFQYYNNERNHTGIGNKTPAEVYFNSHAQGVAQA